MFYSFLNPFYKKHLQKHLSVVVWGEMCYAAFLRSLAFPTYFLLLPKRWVYRPKEQDGLV